MGLSSFLGLHTGKDRTVVCVRGGGFWFGICCLLRVGLGDFLGVAIIDGFVEFS